MIRILARLALAGALIWLPLADASAAVVTITAKDAGGTSRTFNVTTTTDITGALSWNNVICDQATGSTCASVGTAGSPSTNALTVQALTLGHGTAANAMRVELPTDGTGVIATVSAVTAITNALPAGTNLMGKVGIDQTTVGTTNGVSLAQIGATTIASGNGVVGAGVQRVAIASDNTANSNPWLVNPGTIGTWGLAASTQNGTTPTNAGLVMGQFNTSPTTITTGNISPLQLDNAGNLLVNIKAGAGSGGTAITDNAAFTTGTTSETPIGCYAGTPSATANHSTIVACTTAGSVHTTVDNTNANGQATAANSSPVVAPVLTVAGAAVVKASAPVVNGGNFYEAVAASQTATVLQSSTGATGDYLSHCVIYPTSTSPGVVTVFDNTNTAANSAILFVGGSTSTSNLTPITVPVGALSANGAWKVTTGANVSVVCYGKFS